MFKRLKQVTIDVDKLAFWSSVGFAVIVAVVGVPK